MFSERLRALRKERKISQGALAAQLGISQQAVGKWETGRSTPDPGTLRKIADLFGVSADGLLGRDDAHSAPVWPGAEVLVPVLGTVKAGYDAYAFEEDYGSEPANVKNPRDYFYLIVRGDSMEPRISSGRPRACPQPARRRKRGSGPSCLSTGRRAPSKRCSKRRAR